VASGVVPYSECNEQYTKIFNILFPKINPEKQEFSTNITSFLDNIIKLTNEYRKENKFSKKGFLGGWEDALEQLDRSIQKVTMEAPSFSMIISRKPIDILRMSDHPGMRSCHRPPASLEDLKTRERTGRGTADQEDDKYLENLIREMDDEEFGAPEDNILGPAGGMFWECAVHESEGNGAVAYFVSNNSLKKIKDIQAAEIFEDPDRKLEGVVPDGRIRLRRYLFIPTRQELLIPEIAPYGTTKLAKFHTALKEWALQSQATVINAIKSKEDLSADDFILIGGSYTDNPTSLVLTNLLGDIKINSHSSGKNRKISEKTPMMPDFYYDFFAELSPIMPDQANYKEKNGIFTFKMKFRVDIEQKLWSGNPQIQKKYKKMNQAKALEIVKNYIIPIFKKIKINNISGFDTDGSYIQTTFRFDAEIKFPIEYFKNKDKVLHETLDAVNELEEMYKKIPLIQKEIDQTALYVPKVKTKPITEAKIINKMLLLSGIIKK
jgi:hypothetical protein